MTRVLRLLTAAAAGTAILATSVSADAASTLKATYDAAGSTVVAKPNSTVTLAQTTLSAVLRNDGTFYGDLPLKPATASFNIFGLLPASATVNFIPVGRVVGKLVSNPTTKVKAQAVYTLKLTNVTVAGLPAFVGDSCQTSSPVTIPVATPKGQTFDIANGGTVSGTYTIGQFANCGLTTSLINLLVPGPGNTVTLQLSNGRFQS